VPRFYLPLDQVFPQTNVSQFIVLPKDLKVREALRVALAGAAGRASFPRCAAASSCCPTVRPWPTRCSSGWWALMPLVLRDRADEVKAAMRAEPNMRGVNDNWNESVKVLRLEVDQDKARALGVSSQSIAQASQAPCPPARTVGQYREGDKLIDIVLRQPLDERNAITDMANAYLPTSSGQSIPLDADRQAGVHLGAWRDVAREPRLRDHGARRHRGRPAGRHRRPRSCCRSCKRWKLHGQRRAQRLSHRGGRRGGGEQQGLGLHRGRVCPSCCSSPSRLLMLQLQSFSRAMLVFLTGPLGIAGVAGALLLLDRPFGFVALLGVIALMGMIQRNSVILIDQIEQDRAARRAGLGRHRGVGGAPSAAHRADRGGGGAGHDSAVALACSGARWRWPSWAA